MDVSVLVATDTPPFGMLIQQTLESSGRYQVTLVDSGRQALDQATETPFFICIIDSDLPDMSLPDLVWGIRESNLTTRLVLVPPGNDMTDPLVTGLSPAGFLTKPFYLPDLLDTIDRIAGEVKEAPASPAEPLPISLPEDTSTPIPVEPDPRVPSWLQDVTRAAQHLTRLSLESAAQAALIVHNGQMWAYAGELSQPAGQELAQVVAQYWGRDGGSDLARFVRLKSVPGEYMLYATSLAGSMVLALVFDVETPFSKIRLQAGRLARALASPPGEPEGLAQAPSAAPAASKSPLPEWSEDTDPYDDELTDRELPALPPLFDDVPPPNPDAAPAARPPQPKRPVWFEEEPASEPPAPVKTGFGAPPFSIPAFVPEEPAMGQPVDDLEVEEQEAAETPASLPIPEWLPAADLSAPPFVGSILPAAEPLASAQPSRPPSSVPSPAALEPLTDIEPRPEPPAAADDPLAETRPNLASTPPAPSAPSAGPAQAVSEETQAIDLQAASAAVCSLHYACLLIPRLPKHHLTGEMAAHLSEWMPQLSMAFGWRLEHLSIRPDYMQWVISVPPSTSPSYLMRVMRQHTSQRVFTIFTDFAKDNPSGDFWAPGYLIMSSQNPVPPDVTQDFIRQTRQRQGALRPIPRQ